MSRSSSLVTHRWGAQVTASVLALLRRHTRGIRLLLAGAGLLALAMTWILRGDGPGDSVASILSAFIALLGLGGAFTGFRSESRQPEEVAHLVRSEVRVRWGEEAQKRNLLTSLLVPLAAGPLPEREPGAPALTPEEFQRQWAAIVAREGWQRLIVSGAAGTGKTTLALMMTLGLAERMTPLLVPLSSWNPAKTRFDRWINDEVPRICPGILGVEAASRRGRVGELLSSGGYALLLDGFDELPRGTSRLAVAQIERFVPSGAPLVIFTRPSHARALARLPRMRTIAIDAVDGARAAAYLDALAAEHGTVDGLRELLAEVRGGALARAFSTPRNLRAAWLGLREGGVTVAGIRAAGRSGDPAAMSRYLVGRQVARVFGPESPYPMLRKPRAGAWMGFMSRQALAADSRSLPWWHLAETVPRPLLPLAAAASAGPAYLMALSMPVGLTRGAAIGCAVGIAASLMGARPVAARVCLAVFAAVAALVWPLGTLRAGWQQATVDAAEVGLAVTLAVGNLPRLFAAGPSPGASRRRAFAAVVAIAAVTSIATTAVSGLIRYDDPDRGALGLFLGVLLGLGVAVVAARFFVVTATTTRPSTVRLSLRRRRGGLAAPLLLSVAAATSIGLAGAIGGGLRFGLAYAVDVLVFFGLVIGLPVGLTAGFIKWLAAAPLHDPHRAAPANSYLREGTVALTCLASVTIASCGGLLLLDNPLAWTTEPLALHSPTFHVQPANGLLIGATIGMIVASAETAWPAFVIAHCWHALHGSLPWQLHRFIHQLHRAEILRREGEIYRFREEVVLHHFAGVDHRPIRQHRRVYPTDTMAR